MWWTQGRQLPSRPLPDGSAWVNATIAAACGATGTGVRSCDGVARFDGETWQPFLGGSCIADLDLAPDGSVWVVALDPVSQEVGTYVIRPEGVALPEAAAVPFPAGASSVRDEVGGQGADQASRVTVAQVAIPHPTILPSGP